METRVLPISDEAIAEAARLILGGEPVAVPTETVYGLAAAVWTKDVSKAHRIARSIKAGTVWVNTYNLYDPALPFGGFKESGFGRDQGRDALEKYTQTKSVWINL